MRDPASWVGILSCGHIVGSVFRPVDDEVAYVPAVHPMMMQQQVRPQHRPQPPPFSPPPEIGAVVICYQDPCISEGRYVVGLVENIDALPENLAAKRAGMTKPRP